MLKLELCLRDNTVESDAAKHQKDKEEIATWDNKGDLRTSQVKQV